ncbi:MAG: MBL fold metallo-hydrolase [Myxococcales bacterium]
MATLQFLGAAGTVTGSKYVLTANGKKLLVDAGLYQGRKELRERNWKPLPVAPKDIDFAILTHAHIDHTGYLPVFTRDGYRGRVLTTHATKDLCSLLLPDSGRLQEEEAATANKYGYSKHSPAKPLYTEEDAKTALTKIDSIAYLERRQLCEGMAVTFRSAGHILGSATVEVEVQEPGKRLQRILFSGDLGRYNAPVIPDPVPVKEATALLVECTYGNRTHGAVSPKDSLAKAINDAFKRGGAIIIPSFAVGRAQDLLYYLRELENEGRVPQMPVFVDSPMAVDATPIYARHIEDHDEAMKKLLSSGAKPFQTRNLRFTRTRDESKAINDVRQCIIISASGMVTGGRVLHHLKNRLPDKRNTVLFVGYQGDGTRGRQMLDGATEIKMMGELIKVNAHVEVVHGFSAHADYTEVMRWMDGFTTRPRVFCVHGESEGLVAMKDHIEKRGHGWKAEIAGYLQKVELE